MRRNIAVIGASGSVGGAVLDVCSRHRHVFRVWAVAGNRNVERVISIGRSFDSDMLVLVDEFAAGRLKTEVEGLFSCHGGIKGLMSMIDDPRCEEIVFASSGTDTLPVLIKALKAGKKVYLANKEIIVAAGEWIMPIAADRIIPLDSEHNAVWQCLHGEKEYSVKNVFLTASGGPFLDTPMDDLRNVDWETACRHPVWPMGIKISIDSATLMNKGIEMIEAHHLFSLPAGKIHAVIHPQALVHGLVEFIDGSVKMLFSRPDMRLAVLSALGFPDRIPNSAPDLSPPLTGNLSLEFRDPDEKKFPCLYLAKEACRLGGPYPALLIGADEGAVDLFVKGAIGFTEIPEIIEQVLSSYNGGAPASWEESLSLVEMARRTISRSVGSISD